MENSHIQKETTDESKGVNEVNIVVTENAKAYLEKNGYQKPIRVVARDTYECSTMIEFFLTLDEARAEDNIMIVGEFVFLTDKKAEDEIGDYLKIDFVDSQGLKLINRAQTLAYAQKVRG